MSYFFNPKGEGIWECKICSKEIKQRPNCGYSNLISHVSGHDPDYKSTYEDVLKKSGGGTLDSFGFINQKTKDLYQWMSWIVDRNLPLHEIEQKSTRDVVTMQSFSVETLTKYMQRVTESVEKCIADDLTNHRFAIVFDGWTRFAVHYLALFAVYKKKGQKRVVLLAIAPPIDEESYNADEHITFIEGTLSIYGKSLGDVCVFVGDNCETNQSISRKTGIALIGCYSHKFNLAVKAHLDECREKNAIAAVHDLMVELRTLKNAARLRKLGVKAAKVNNATRWSSIFEMIKRYFEIIEQVECIETTSVQEKLLMRSEHKMLPVEDVMIRLKQMEDVTKELQRDDLTLDEARDLFDGMTDLFPEMGHHLDERAEIVVDPTLETAIVKVLRDQRNVLTPSEKAKLECFKENTPLSHSSSVTETEDDDTLNFAQRLLKKRRVSVHDPSEFMDLSFIPPTSNIVERLFSAAKLVLRDQRASLLPITFEMLLFLKVNRDWWNLQTVHKAMQAST